MYEHYHTDMGFSHKSQHFFGHNIFVFFNLIHNTGSILIHLKKHNISQFSINYQKLHVDMSIFFLIRRSIKDVNLFF